MKQVSNPRVTRIGPSSVATLTGIPTSTPGPPQVATLTRVLELRDALQPATGGQYSGGDNTSWSIRSRSYGGLPGRCSSLLDRPIRTPRNCVFRSADGSSAPPLGIRSHKIRQSGWGNSFLYSCGEQLQFDSFVHITRRVTGHLQKSAIFGDVLEAFLSEPHYSS